MLPPDDGFPGDRPEEVSPNFRAALAGIVDREFLQSRRYQEQGWRADRTGCHPDLIEFEKVFVKRMAKLGVPMFAHEFYRSPEKQNDAYARGASRARAGQSAHQFGCAVDIIHSRKLWDMEPKAWMLIDHVGKEIISQKGLRVENLFKNGEWAFYDPAHWQVIGWKELKGGYPWPTTYSRK